MPEDPRKPSPQSGRPRPNLSDLKKETTEEDLWDLDDDQETKPRDDNAAAENPAARRRPSDTAAIPQEPRSKPGKPAVQPAERPKVEPSPSGKKDVAAVELAPRSIDPELRPTPPKAQRPHGPNAGDDLETQIDRVPDPEALAEAERDAAEADTVDTDESSTKKSQPIEADESASDARPNSSAERLGLWILGATFLILAVWWVFSLFSSIPTTRMGDDQPEFPVEGRFSTIRLGETYWREPIRTGENPDVARIEVEFIPVLELTLKQSQSGVLRAIFRDDQGDFIGDAISHSFENGVFDENGQATIEFAATDGFEEVGSYNHYRVGSDRWTVQLYEGPSLDAAGSEFKLLFTSPVSTNRK